MVLIPRFVWSRPSADYSRYVPSNLTPEQDSLAISVIRGLAMDAPLAANSGHQGTAMSLAPLAHVLYSRIMNHDPKAPQWMNRDRFILSNGHASILQYSMLFLSGYGLEISDLKEFRQWGSATPGHPEAGHTAGVEVTTGPLGVHLQALFTAVQTVEFLPGTVTAWVPAALWIP